MNIDMTAIESVIRKAVKDAVDSKEQDELESKWNRVHRDSPKRLAELIDENNLRQFSDMGFDWFDDPLGVVFIPCRGYAIMARSTWGKSADGKHELFAEYAIYSARQRTGIMHDNLLGEPVLNDLSYDAVYTLVTVCKETFENIALAVSHATAQIYMKEV